MRQRHYVFIAGGVMSGVGKGTCAAALGALLQSHGFSVTAVKIDPYINVDAGTMNPVEHGEVFVTHDGDETDQDIGNYERFLNVDISRVNYMTTGRVYLSVIERERALGYGGKTVQVVPDVPNEVIERIEKAAETADADITLVEIGGTVGEYENILFLEAARLMRLKYDQRVRTVLVSYLPVPGATGEMKTKPTQQAVRHLMATGLIPDFIVARAEKEIDEPRKRKLAIFGNVQGDQVIASPNVNSVYELPEKYAEQGFGVKLLQLLGLEAKEPDFTLWRNLAASTRATEEVKIAVLGKYFSTGDFTLSDAYISVIEAIKHAAFAQGKKAKLVWLNSEEYEQHPEKLEELRTVQGVVVPGGFGSRGVEGKIAAIRFCRENKIPYLGLCYGMQCAVIEFARHVGLAEANTEEINPQTTHPVIHLLAGQDKNIAGGKMGGTMRLGSYTCALTPGTTAATAYATSAITERHRHRYEFNNAYRQQLLDAGLVISGLNPEQDLVEIIEVKDHPFFVGVQFHPEFLSRPMRPHPLFMGFVRAAIG
jgi:CTP synthase